MSAQSSSLHLSYVFPFGYSISIFFFLLVIEHIILLDNSRSEKRAYSYCEATKHIERNKARVLSWNWKRVRRWRRDGGGGEFGFGRLPWAYLVLDRRRWRRSPMTGGDKRNALFIERNKAGVLSWNWTCVGRWRRDGGGSEFGFRRLPWAYLVLDRRRWRRSRMTGGDERDALFVSVSSGGGEHRRHHFDRNVARVQRRRRRRRKVKLEWGFWLLVWRWFQFTKHVDIIVVIRIWLFACQAPRKKGKCYAHIIIYYHYWFSWYQFIYIY